MENSNQTKSQAIKLPKRKVFQIIQRNLASAGITPNLLNQPYPVNGKIFVGFLILGLFMCCNFKYTFYEAKTFVEYTQTVYVGSLAAVIFLALTIIILKVDKLFELIDECENIVQTS